MSRYGNCRNILYILLKTRDCTIVFLKDELFKMSQFHEGSGMTGEANQACI